MGIREHMYRLPDTQLFVQRAGRADRVILLVHGFLASTFTWRYMFPYLSPHFTVYAVDLPGFGRSAKDRSYHYTLEGFAQTLHAFVQAEGIRQVTVMAHSMGGQVALRLAKRAPETVQRLVLIAPSGYLRSAKRWQKIFFRLPFAYCVLPLLLTPQRIDKQLRSVYYNLSNMNVEELYDGYITPLKERDFHRALFQFGRSREDDLSSMELRDIRQPTLLLWGRHDRIVPLNIGKRLLRDLPNARLEIIEETGHLPMEEKPLDVVERLAPFLHIPVPSGDSAIGHAPSRRQ
ncbi:alpha/beta fold hydrolase [Novibacillus thermophilus]|uniref:AB hydrolase-1 domain-containing protein n=1 Tax=Novibacillus thermophilus TaxID=1471761 RepID=A0A1U9K3R7_9BACL|nr:alpha/beta hydrolase [Novibacillus thermophilus]AQS54678.1 hypothetical protein B0W44_01660 [Novibacillus thermophilus]